MIIYMMVGSRSLHLVPRVSPTKGMRYKLMAPRAKRQAGLSFVFIANMYHCRNWLIFAEL